MSIRDFHAALENGSAVASLRSIRSATVESIQSEEQATGWPYWDFPGGSAG